MGQRVHDKADHYIRHGNRKRLRLLLKKHPELRVSNEAMLIFTAIWRNRGMVKWLLQQRVSPDTRMGDDGNTPLMQAASEGDISLVKLLLQFGADPNALNEERENPLGFAVSWQQPNAIKVLVEHGADVALNPETWSISGRRTRGVYLKTTIGLSSCRRHSAPSVTSSSRDMNGGTPVSAISVK